MTQLSDSLRTVPSETFAAAFPALFLEICRTRASDRSVRRYSTINVLHSRNICGKNLFLRQRIAKTAVRRASSKPPRALPNTVCQKTKQIKKGRMNNEKNFLLPCLPVPCWPPCLPPAPPATLPLPPPPTPRRLRAFLPKWKRNLPRPLLPRPARNPLRRPPLPTPPPPPRARAHPRTEAPPPADVSLNTILDAVKNAYGESYLPSMDLTAEDLDARYGLKADDYDEALGQVAMISTQVDTFVAVKAKGRQSGRCGFRSERLPRRSCQQLDAVPHERTEG